MDKLKKNASRQSETQRTNEAAFINQLGDLFDIAHQDALTLIKNPEDREFLLAQRESGRCGSMGPVDNVLATKEARALKKKENEYNRQQQAQQEEHSMNETVELCLSADSADNTETGDMDDDFLPFRRNLSEEPSTSTPKHRKRARKSIISPELAATMDRTKLSDRKATFMLPATARSLGNDVNDYTINRSSIRRERHKLRQDISQDLKNKFNPNTPLTVHWDGKLLKDLTGKN